MSLKTIKHYSVHAFGLILSLAAILHTMTQFSDILLFKVFFGAGGIFAGLSIQYLRGRAAAHRKRFRESDDKNDRYKANGYWAIVIISIIIFDFVSAFTVLLTQIDKAEGKYDVLAVKREEVSADIRTIEDDIKTKKAEQKEEFKNKGRGPKYDTYQKEIDNLESKLESKKRERDSLRDQVGKMDKSIFARLQEHSGIPSFWFELSMVGGLMFLIYLIPLLTPWNIKLEPISKTVSSENATEFESVATESKTVRFKKSKWIPEPRTCLNPECNKVFMPSRRDKEYCCEPCRNRAWRLGAKHPEETAEGVMI